MAFEENVTRPVNEAWKSDAFLNFYIPKSDGTRSKLGAISLKLTNANQKALIQYLKEGGEAAVAKLLNNMQVDFNMVDPNASIDPSSWE